MKRILFVRAPWFWVGHVDAGDDCDQRPWRWWWPWRRRRRRPCQRGGGGHVSGGHAAASMGSVHYGARAAPAQVGPAVRTGSVRSEHYAGSPSRGIYRNPYRDEYFRHFPPGYRSFVFGDASITVTTACRLATNWSC